MGLCHGILGVYQCEKCKFPKKFTINNKIITEYDTTCEVHQISYGYCSDCYQPENYSYSCKHLWKHKWFWNL